jgi:hypothetical protein
MTVSISTSTSHGRSPRPLSSLGTPCLSVVPARQNNSLLTLGLTVSIPGLEKALQQYTLEPSEKPFDLKSVPLATTPMAEQRPGKALLIPRARLFPWTVECARIG